MVFDIDVTILYGILGISLIFFFGGIVIGWRNHSPIGIVLGLIGGIIWISVWSLADNVYVGYTTANIANTTESGGTTTCTVSGATTTCTVSPILKKFDYYNSTGQLTNNTNSLPNKYPLVGLEPTGEFSQNFYIKIYMLTFGVIMILVGTFQYRFGGNR